MATDPNYVKLAKRLQRGIQADLRSGWSIAGLDVQKFPSEDKVAAKYVRTALRDGRLEAATKSEYETVQEEAAAVADSSPSYAREERALHQEQQIRDKAAASAKRVKAAGEQPSPVEESGSEEEPSESEAADEDNEAYTESSLKKLNKNALANIAESEFGIDVEGDELDTKAKLITAILLEQDADEEE
jgi:hypothetical protein